MEAKAVKKDLRQLRTIAYSIERQLEVKRRHEERLEVLRSKEQTEEVKEAIERTEKALASLDIAEDIQQAAALEARYMEAISRLDRLDRAIILDGYINGTPYWKIGRSIGYSERGVQERVRIIVKRLAEML